MILLHLSISNQAHCERQQQVLIGADATVRVLCAPASRSTALPVLICAVDVDVASAQPAACDWLRLSLPRSRRFAASFLSQCVCMCVCARVCSWLWLWLCVCVCVRVLSWISSSAAAVPDSYITRPKKVSWLARVYFAFVARRVHTSLARLARNTHRIQTDRIRIRIRIRIRLRNDLRHGLRIQFCDSESASEFRALRLQFIACCLSLSLSPSPATVCVPVCVYICLSVY